MNIDYEALLIDGYHTSFIRYVDYPTKDLQKLVLKYRPFFFYEFKWLGDLDIKLMKKAIIKAENPEMYRDRYAEIPLNKRDKQLENLIFKPRTIGDELNGTRSHNIKLVKNRNLGVS